MCVRVCDIQLSRDAEGIRLDTEALGLQPVVRSRSRDHRQSRTRSRTPQKLRVGDPRYLVQPPKYIKIPTTFEQFEKLEGRTKIKTRGKPAARGKKKKL